MTDGALTPVRSFLAKLLIESERQAILDEPYASARERFDTQVFLLSSAFRHIMTDEKERPWYGVRGALTEPALEKIHGASKDPEADNQFVWASTTDEAMALLEIALQDPAFRTVLHGLMLGVREALQFRAAVEAHPREAERAEEGQTV